MARTLVNSIDETKTAQVGDVVQSMLTEAQMQSLRGTGWVLMDGRGVTAAELGEDSAYYLLTTNANIPDARGLFLRGKNNGRSTTTGNATADQALGVYESDAIRNITGKYSGGRGLVVPAPAGAFGFESVNNLAGPNNGTSSEINFNFDASRVVPTAAENRTRNITVNIFIKIN